MSVSSINAHNFYREVAANKVVWAIRDKGGFTAPVNSEGERAMPFWSLESRALTVIRNVKAYRDFETVSIDWDTFCKRWVPGLKRDGLLVGVNWTGARATGYDLQPVEVQRNVEALMD